MLIVLSNITHVNEQLDVTPSMCDNFIHNKHVILIGDIMTREQRVFENRFRKLTRNYSWKSAQELKRIGKKTKRLDSKINKIKKELHDNREADVLELF